MGGHRRLTGRVCAVILESDRGRCQPLALDLILTAAQLVSAARTWDAESGRYPDLLADTDR